MAPRKHALVCAPVMPEHDRESGSRRIYDLLMLLRDEGWSVTFASHHCIGKPDRYVKALQQAGVETYPGIGDDIEPLLRDRSTQLAILAFWEIAELYLPAIRRLAPGARIIIDSIDLHFVRNARRTFVESSTGAEGALLDQKFGAELTRELNIYAAADAVLTVSHKEANFVGDLLGDSTAALVVCDSEALPCSPVPFHSRQGVLFIGNFRHAPNRQAVEFLCGHILPKVNPALLQQHPVYIVGNDLDDEVRDCTRKLPFVRIVGWVPSIVPYLERSRITVIPVQYGAGTKRKLIQALMIGTPAVSTTIGIEGLDLRDGEQVLVADDPSRFAGAIERLLTDQECWERLAAAGHSHIVDIRGPEAARRQLLQALDRVFAKPPKRPRQLEARDTPAANPAQYGPLVQRIRELATAALPRDARVLVISKGDDQLLNLSGRQAWHFPCEQDGTFSGSYPRDSEAAIADVERLRNEGADYLLVPAVYLWWLDYYEGLRQHLETHCQLLLDRPDTCLIFALRPQTDIAAAAVETDHVDRDIGSLPPERFAFDSWGQPSHDTLLRLRPAIVSPERILSVRPAPKHESVLVLGIYLADRPNNVHDTVEVLAEAAHFDVHQRWIRLGGDSTPEKVARVTVSEIRERKPKFELVNELLAREDGLYEYDYVLLVDDDVVLPRQFIDYYLHLQRTLGFALAQPARTSCSHIDHPIVEQQQGAMARQTLFVEIGPVVSFARAVFELFPFDLLSPMGWGYENVWSSHLSNRGLKMGIIDAVPVDHSLRAPVAHYSWTDADRDRQALLAKYAAPRIEDCFRVINVITTKKIAKRSASQLATH